jgi:hypothetical protein
MEFQNFLNKVRPVLPAVFQYDIDIGHCVSMYRPFVPEWRLRWDC